MRFDSAAGPPVLQEIYGTPYCLTHEIKLLSDTAAIFDPTTGSLRIGIVIENVGTRPLVPRVRVRFNADSVLRYNGSDQLVAGASDVLGYLPDSASSNGRIALYWFDDVLAPATELKVLRPGDRTQRRWIELRGTTWTARMRLKLAAVGTYQVVPALPPDSLPASLANTASHVALGSGTAGVFVRDMITLQFAGTATQAQKDSIVASVSGTIVGGRQFGIEGGGIYVVRLPSDPTHARIASAIASLKSHSAVRAVARYVLWNIKGDYLRPVDGVVVQPESHFRSV